MSQLILDAFRIALDAHYEQRYGSEPYIYHPLDVAEQVSHLGEHYIVTALLHDVIEDHPEFKPVVATAVPNPVYAALKLLTRSPEVRYLEYIRRIRETRNAIALAVKLADLHSNLSHSPNPSLISRYKAAQAILNERDYQA